MNLTIIDEGETREINVHELKLTDPKIIAVCLQSDDELIECHIRRFLGFDKGDRVSFYCFDHIAYFEAYNDCRELKLHTDIGAAYIHTFGSWDKKLCKELYAGKWTCSHAFVEDHVGRVIIESLPDTVVIDYNETASNIIDKHYSGHHNNYYFLKRV